MNLAKAIAFAALKHEGQTRREGTPYIYHPLRVAEIVKDAGYDESYQIVAVLHDVLEDTDATEEEVREFGDDVLEAVKLLSRPKGIDETIYVDNILKNHLAAVVKNADKINNLLDAGYSGDIGWANKYIKKAQLYYKDKFSAALDFAINEACDVVCTQNPVRKRVPCYSPKEMMLYAEDILV